MNETSAKTSRPAFAAWVVFLVAISFNAFDAFLRVTPSVTSEQLQSSLGVGPNALGTMLTFYFIPYVLLQIPVGMMIDRVGAKRLLIVAVGLSAIGAVVYGAASVVAVAFLGRLLMGIGGAVPGVAPIYLASRWFPRSSIGFLAGLTGTSTVIGSIGGEAALARVLDTWTWREASYAAAAMGALIGVLIFLLVRDRPPGQSREPEADASSNDPTSTVWIQLSTVFRNPRNWLNSIWGGLTLMPMLAFTSLWATPFFTEHFSVSTAQAAAAASTAFLGLAFGGPAAGLLSERLRSRRKPMMLFAGVAMLDLLLLIYTPDLGFAAAFPLMFVLGFCLGSQGSLVFAVALEINADREAGLAIGFTQALSNLGGAVFPPLIGFLLTRAPAVPPGLPVSADAYQLALSVLPAGLAAAVVLAFLLPETYRGDEPDRSDTPLPSARRGEPALGLG